MIDLISKIRSAQIRAGEDAVCDHLREMEAGLLLRSTNPAEKPSPDADTVRQTDELKPCPFCGEIPGDGRHVADESQGHKWGAVVCNSCRCVGPEVRTGYKNPPAHWGPEADAAWNCRA